MLNQSDVNAPSGVEFSSMSRLDKLVAPVLSTTLIATPLLRSTESMEETAEATGGGGAHNRSKSANCRNARNKHQKLFMHN